MKYPWQTINPRDAIQIEGNQPLTMQNMHVLTRLFQPIIGSDAQTLYLRLYADLHFEARTANVTVAELLRKCDMGIPAFYQARIKLEGIGLLNVYRGTEDQNTYIYQVVQPMSAEDFFQDPLLYTLLMEKIGERLFKKEMETFLPEGLDKKRYEDLTHNFVDVFHVDLKQSNLVSNTHFQVIEEGKRPKLSETIENVDSFDYNFFKAGLSKHFVRRDALTQEIKELIYTFHVVYGIDEMTMQSLILESADVESGQINKNKFTSTVQRSFLNQQKQQPAKSPQVLQAQAETNPSQTAVANKTSSDAKGLTTTEQQVVNYAKQVPPATFLQSIKDQKGGFVTSNETWILKELAESSRLNKEVINILLHYVLVVKESVVFEKNFAMKIANSWAQSGVRTAEAAIQKVKEVYTEAEEKRMQGKSSGGNRSYQNNYRNSRKKETLPDWAKESTADSAKENGQQNLEAKPSSFDEGTMKDRLENIRKLREQREDN